MRIASVLKNCLVVLSLAAIAVWMAGCAKESTTPTTTSKTPAVGSTTGPGAEVPEPAAEEKKDEPKADSEAKPDEKADKPAEEKTEEKPKEKKPE